MELWTHQFCLACDTQTDGPVYCSEACKLADFDKSSPCASPSSPGYFSWESPKESTSPYAKTTYDFSSSQSFFRSVATHRQYNYNTNSTTTTNTTASPQRVSFVPRQRTSSIDQSHNLSLSSSHSSLNSIQAVPVPRSSYSPSSSLSDQSKQELQAYALAFEQVRSQRRTRE